MALADRIAVFNGGAMPYATKYNRPANKFVANFVGDREINFLSATVSTGSDSGVPSAQASVSRCRGLQRRRAQRW